jgi:hypothetical protein
MDELFRIQHGIFEINTPREYHYLNLIDNDGRSICVINLTDSEMADELILFLKGKLNNVASRIDIQYIVSRLLLKERVRSKYHINGDVLWKQWVPYKLTK